MAGNRRSKWRCTAMERRPVGGNASLSAIARSFLIRMLFVACGGEPGLYHGRLCMRFLFANLLFAFVFTAYLGAQDETKIDLNIGDRAPAFESKDAAGLAWKSSDHLGKKYIVVYFYPGDFT